MQKKDKFVIIMVIILSLFFLFSLCYLVQAEPIEFLEGGDIKKAQQTNQYY